MVVIKDFGCLSGYKTDEKKTKIITRHLTFVKEDCVKKQYIPAITKVSVKYLRLY